MCRIYRIFLFGVVYDKQVCSVFVNSHSYWIRNTHFFHSNFASTISAKLAKSHRIETKEKHKIQISIETIRFGKRINFFSSSFACVTRVVYEKYIKEKRRRRRRKNIKYTAAAAAALRARKRQTKLCLRARSCVLVHWWVFSWCIGVLRACDFSRCDRDSARERKIPFYFQIIFM